MMIDNLLLLSGNDIPFPQARLIVHQPRLHEIAYMGEQNFWMGSQLLVFDKQKDLQDKDKVDLVDQSNFNIIMAMIQNKNQTAAQFAKINVLSILALLFPIYKIKINKRQIILENIETNEQSFIDSENFIFLQEIIKEIFCLGDSVQEKFDPSGALAKKIADQIRKGKQRRAQLAPEANKVISILSRYASVLSIGQKQSINDFMGYTVYQLMDAFVRFELKTHHDIWMQYKVGGFSGMQDPDDWFKDIHEKSKSNSKNI